MTRVRNEIYNKKVLEYGDTEYRWLLLRILMIRDEICRRVGQ